MVKRIGKPMDYTRSLETSSVLLLHLLWFLFTPVGTSRNLLSTIILVILFVLGASYFLDSMTAFCKSGESWLSVYI